MSANPSDPQLPANADAAASGREPMLGPRHLRARWLTAEGIRLRAEILNRLQCRREWAEPPEMAGASLTGSYLDVRGIDFAKTCFRGCRLAFLNLDYAVFDECDLVSANIQQCSLNGASFRNALLIGTQIIFVDAQDARFEGANLSGASLGGSNFSRAAFNGTVLVAADLGGAGFQFADTNFSHADFRNADLRSADLSRAILALADLSSARLPLKYP